MDDAKGMRRLNSTTVLWSKVHSDLRSRQSIIPGRAGLLDFRRAGN